MLLKGDFNRFVAGKAGNLVGLLKLQSVKIFLHALKMTILSAVTNAYRSGVSDFLATGVTAIAELCQE